MALMSMAPARAGEIVPDPADANRLYTVRYASFGGGQDLAYISVTHGQLFVSNDAGQSWSPLSEEGINVRGVQVDPFETSRLYLQTFGAGVLISSDGGASWLPAGAPMDSGDITQLVPSRQVPGLIWARKKQDLYRSDDGGVSWSAVLPGTGIVSVELSPADPDRVYAVTNTPEILESLDGGASWRDHTTAEQIPAGVSGPESWMLRADPLDPDVLFAAFFFSDEVHYRHLFISEPGQPWRELLINGAPAGVQDLETSATGLGSIYVVQKNLSTVIAPDIPVEPGLYRSEDRGVSWQRTDLPLGDPGGNLTPWSGSESTLYLHGFHYYRSEDAGASWISLVPPPVFDPATAAATDLAAGVSPAGASLSPGRKTISIQVNNRGARPAAGALVKVTMTLGGDLSLPAVVDHTEEWGFVTKGGTEFFSGEFIIQEQYVVCEIGTLLAGESISIPLQYDLSAQDGSASIVVEILQSSARDTNAGNDMAQKIYTISTASGTGGGTTGGGGSGGGGGGAAGWALLAMLLAGRRMGRARN
jgi:hypothetical protein